MRQELRDSRQNRQKPPDRCKGRRTRDSTAVTCLLRETKEGKHGGVAGELSTTPLWAKKRQRSWTGERRQHTCFAAWCLPFDKRCARYRCSATTPQLAGICNSCKLPLQQAVSMQGTNEPQVLAHQTTCSIVTCQKTEEKNMDVINDVW